MAPRLRASPRHGGANYLFFTLGQVIEPPRGRPAGGGGVYQKINMVQ